MKPKFLLVIPKPPKASSKKNAPQTVLNAIATKLDEIKEIHTSTSVEQLCLPLFR